MAVESKAGECRVDKELAEVSQQTQWSELCTRYPAVRPGLAQDPCMPLGNILALLPQHQARSVLEQLERTLNSALNVLLPSPESRALLRSAVQRQIDLLDVSVETLNVVCPFVPLGGSALVMPEKYFDGQLESEFADDTAEDESPTSGVSGADGKATDLGRQHVRAAQRRDLVKQRPTWAQVRLLLSQSTVLSTKSGARLYLVYHDGAVLLRVDADTNGRITPLDVFLTLRRYSTKEQEYVLLFVPRYCLNGCPVLEVFFA